MLTAAGGRKGHGDRGALCRAFSRGVSPGKGRSLAPRHKGNGGPWSSDPWPGIPSRPIPLWKRPAKSPSTRQIMAAPLLKGTGSPRAVTAPRGTIVPGTRSGGAETRGHRVRPVPMATGGACCPPGPGGSGGGGGHRARPVRGVPAAPPLRGVLLAAASDVPCAAGPAAASRVFTRLFCRRYLRPCGRGCTQAVVTLVRLWGSCCGTGQPL